MNSKSTTNVANSQQFIHQLPAGIIQGDKRTELFGCRETKKLFAVSDGKTIPFSEISHALKAQIFQKYLQDVKAMNDLSHLPLSDALEKFAYCVYGALDHEPDFDDSGRLKAADNFICSPECTCLTWSSKSITVDGNALTVREIQIIQLLASDSPDKQIADLLKITTSTLDSHKQNLFRKFNVFSTKGMITKAIGQKIIQ